jgi:hypothetical protein
MHNDVFKIPSVLTKITGSLNVNSIPIDHSKKRWRHEQVGNLTEHARGIPTRRACILREEEMYISRTIKTNLVSILNGILLPTVYSHKLICNN